MLGASAGYRLAGVSNRHGKPCTPSQGFAGFNCFGGLQESCIQQECARPVGCCTCAVDATLTWVYLVTFVNL